MGVPTVPPNQSRWITPSPIVSTFHDLPNTYYGNYTGPAVISRVQIAALSIYCMAVSSGVVQQGDNIAMAGDNIDLGRVKHEVCDAEDYVAVIKQEPSDVSL